jgi:hypothetical protein
MSITSSSSEIFAQVAEHYFQVLFNKDDFERMTYGVERYGLLGEKCKCIVLARDPRDGFRFSSALCKKKNQDSTKTFIYAEFHFTPDKNTVTGLELSLKSCKEGDTIIETEDGAFLMDTPDEMILSVTIHTCAENVAKKSLKKSASSSSK